MQKCHKSSKINGLEHFGPQKKSQNLLKDIEKNLPLKRKNGMLGIRK